MNIGIRRLPLEGLSNCRDLGGFSTAGGGVTNYHAFLRCEVPQRVTDSDLAYLKAYGLKTSIDFMGDSEIERHASRLSDVPWVKYIRCPSFNQQVAGERGHSTQKVDTFVNWGDFYIGMLTDCGAWIRNVLETAAANEGTVMYNCATGKDRTGLISAMLLGIAGVCEEDIIADYAVSMVYLHRVYQYIVPRFSTVDENGQMNFEGPFFRTDPGNMGRVLNHIRDNYGSVEKYVFSLGTDPSAVEEIRRRLVD